MVALRKGICPWGKRCLFSRDNSQGGPSASGTPSNGGKRPSCLKGETQSLIHKFIWLSCSFPSSLLLCHAGPHYLLPRREATPFSLVHQPLTASTFFWPGHSYQPDWAWHTKPFTDTSLSRNISRSSKATRALEDPALLNVLYFPERTKPHCTAVPSPALSPLPEMGAHCLTAWLTELRGQLKGSSDSYRQRRLSSCSFQNYYS